MELFEYQTMAWTDDIAHMLEQLNEAGAHGWEVCAQGSSKTGSWVIGRVPPPQPDEAELLLLKRRKAE